MYISFLLQSPSKSSQASQRTGAGADREDDSDAESHTAPVEEADDSLVEATSCRPPRSTSSKRSAKSSKSGTVVGLLEAIYHDANTAQKEMRQKVNM